MAWLQRNGRQYYRRSVRNGDRVRTEYIGCGPMAALIAHLDEARREQRATRAVSQRAEGERLEAEDRAAVALFALVEVVTQAILEAMGYHRHDRGPWRRRRMGKFKAMAIDATDPPPTEDEIRDMLARAGAGDKPALRELRDLAERHPKIVAEYCGGDLAARTENVAVYRIYEENPGLSQGLPLRLAMLREELAGPEPTELERLLVERVLLCWLDVYRLEVHHYSSGSDDGDLLDRRRDRANRRYLAALKALAQVRKLALPSVNALQVNVGSPFGIDSEGLDVVLGIPRGTFQDEVRRRRPGPRVSPD